MRKGRRRPAFAGAWVTLGCLATVACLIVPFAVSFAFLVGQTRDAPAVKSVIREQSLLRSPTNSGLNQTVGGALPEWDNITSSISTLPLKRYGEGLAFDPVTNETVLFGGYNDNVGLLNDTWVFHSNNWTKLAEPVAPSPRYQDVAMAYDPSEEGIVLFGGDTVLGPELNDTWFFNGIAWKDLNLSVAPPEVGATIAWDPALSGMLCYDAATPAQTWLFQQGKWLNLTLSVEPATVYQPAMTYDPTNGTMLFFGGITPTGNESNETWEFSGNWKLSRETVAPSARQDAQMVYDAQLGSVVLFGGATTSGVYGDHYFNDSWSFSSGNWTRLLPTYAPPALWLASMTYDSALGRVILTDGQDIRGATISCDWVLYLSTLKVTTSLSSSMGKVPFSVWLNSTISGGYPPYTVFWSVSDGITGNEQDLTLTFNESGNYTANQSVTDRWGVRLTLSFSILALPSPKYEVAFRETGLPSGTMWSVTLNFLKEQSASDEVTFSEYNGSYGYSIGFVSGYRPIEAFGNVTLLGSSETVNLTFSAVEYGITFEELGLKIGTGWSVNLSGAILDSKSPEIGFSETNGTYLFSVGNVLGYLPSLQAGEVTVSGSSVLVTINFTQVQYSITFTEGGLPYDTNWSVVVNGTSQSSMGNSTLFAEPNGNYSFSVGPVAGYQATPKNGMLTVKGRSVTESIIFASTSKSSPTFLGLTAWEGYALLVGPIVVIVITAILVILAFRRRRKSAQVPPPTPAPPDRPPGTT